MSYAVPAEAQTLYDVAKEEIERVITEYEERKLDGLTFKEVYEVITTAIASFVRLIEFVGGAHPGKWKKAVVIAAMEEFFVRVIKPIDLPLPDWLEWAVVDPVLERSISPFVSALIDGLVTIFDRVGWSLDEEVAPDPI
jgi:hypothetical protein